jgi:hypothetical protein
MFELKPIHQEAIPRSLEKAERYRLLNEPEQAESICRDILRVDPENQPALIMLLLALTDQFDKGLPATRPRELLSRLHGEYERAYYAGIICERKARAQLNQGLPGAGYAAYDSLREAMSRYEKAEAMRPPGNDDATLRWNACARTIMDRHLVARAEEIAQVMSE